MKTGIDVSAHNGTINWKIVKTDFAILRAGWSWYEGGMNVDKQFVTNASGISGANIPWGVYIYAYDKSVSAAITAANTLCDMLDKGKYELSYPVVYDFEDKQYFNTSKELNTTICKTFLSVIKKRGYYPVIYTYTNFAKAYLNMDDLAEYDFWVADYTGKVGWNGKYSIWQYTANGKVDGISTNVDMNHSYKDYPTIIHEMKVNNTTSSISKSHREKLLSLLDIVENGISMLRDYINKL